MSFFKKLFGGDNKSEKNQKQHIYTDNGDIENNDPIPNDDLINLLNAWSKQESEDTFQAVIKELNEGSSFLLLPLMDKNDDEAHEWKTLEFDNIQLTSVFEVEGFSVLTAFSDEKSLFEWSLKDINYKKLSTQDVLRFAELYYIDNIVINSGLLNMFILEYNRNKEDDTAREDQLVKVEIPSQPLNDTVIERLIAHFDNITPINEAYQYLHTIDENTSLMIGVRLSTDNENIRTVMIEAIKDSLQGDKPENPLGIMLLDDNWIEKMKSINNPPFFRR